MGKSKMKNYKKKYHISKENLVKMYEIDIVLSKDGKTYKAFAPSCAATDVLNALDNIIMYIKKYGEIGFDVYAEPVV